MSDLLMMNTRQLREEMERHGLSWANMSRRYMIKTLEGLSKANTKTVGFKPSPPDSRDLVFEMDDWGRLLWDEQYGDQIALQDAVALVDDNNLTNTEWPAMPREVFGRMYEAGCDRMETPAVGADWAVELHAAADELEEWDECVRECGRDPYLAGVGSARISTELHKLLGDKKPPRDATDDAAVHAEFTQAAAEARAKGKNRSAEKFESLAQKAKEKVLRSIADNIEATRSIQDVERHKMRSAFAAGREAIKEAKASMSNASGFCLDGGDSIAAREAARRCANSEVLRQIAEVAGRMQATCDRAERAQIKRDGRGEVVGVTIGRDLSQAFVTERAMFGHPIIGALQVAKLSQGRIGQNRQIGFEDVDKAGGGPLLFVVDESGSMGGGVDSPFVVAKAAMLVLARYCYEAGRPFGVVLFGSRHQQHTKVFIETPSADELMDLAEHNWQGGTDIASALRAARSALDNGPLHDEADCILLTDACVREVGGAIQDQANDIRKESGARLHSIIVGDESGGYRDVVESSDSVTFISGSNIGDQIALSITPTNFRRSS